MVAKAHVQSAHDEKQDDGSDEKEVAHCPTSFSRVRRRTFRKILHSWQDALMGRVINSLNLEWHWS